MEALKEQGAETWCFIACLSDRCYLSQEPPSKLTVYFCSTRNRISNDNIDSDQNKASRELQIHAHRIHDRPTTYIAQDCLYAISWLSVTFSARQVSIGQHVYGVDRDKLKKSNCWAQ